MKKITALEVQKKNPNRVNVHLDGEFVFGMFSAMRNSPNYKMKMRVKRQCNKPCSS